MTVKDFASIVTPGKRVLYAGLRRLMYCVSVCDRRTVPRFAILDKDLTLKLGTSEQTWRTYVSQPFWHIHVSCPWCATCHSRGPKNPTMETVLEMLPGVLAKWRKGLAARDWIYESWYVQRRLAPSAHVCSRTEAGCSPQANRSATMVNFLSPSWFIHENRSKQRQTHTGI